MSRQLKDIISTIPVISVNGSTEITTTGLTYDSRMVKPGFIFFATDGVHSDGHHYIDTAIANGATVIIYSTDPEKFHPGITYVKTSNPRTAMSPAAAAFFDYPSKTMKVAGITGTDGKSTTVSLTQQLIEKTGNSCGFLSTVEYKAGDEIKPNPYRQSTPEATEIQAILREMYDNGSRYAVIEATSHGLSTRNNRLGDIEFDAAVFTNVTHEHLEFHGTIEQYREDKANLFRYLDKNSKQNKAAIINMDDPNYKLYIQASKVPAITYSLKNPSADAYVKNIKPTSTFGYTFTLVYKQKEYNCKLNLAGTFNIENALAAILTASILTGKSVEFFIPFLEELSPVKGRMNSIQAGQPFNVIVDYAHTPGAFEKLFPIIKKDCKGRLIALFGSGGERDTEKRPVQGFLASQYADYIILTDEDPRGEQREKILRDIAAGCKNMTEDLDLFIIPDRKEAIEAAIKLAGPDDTVLLLGKGHESTILYSDKKMSWDESEAALSALKKCGYHLEIMA